MGKKTPTNRVKHIPQRTCVGCQEVDSKRNLVRIVRTPAGIEIDLGGKASGRGVYLHKKTECWQKAVPKRIAHALKTDLGEEEKDKISEFLQQLESQPSKIQTIV